MWPNRSIHVYHCNLVTHHFKLSNKNSSRIIYDADLIYSNTISEQNRLTRAVGGTLIIDQFPTPLFFPSLTYIFSYVCFLQTNNVIFSVSEICKHILLFKFWSEPPNVNRKQPKSRIASHLESPWTEAKVRDTLTASSLQRRCHSAGLWHGVLHGVTRLTRVGQPGVFSVHARATRRIPGTWPCPFGRGVTRALLKVQLCFAWTLANCLPLFTSSVFFFFSFSSFLAVLACLRTNLVFLVTDNCLAVALWLGCSDGVSLIAGRGSSHWSSSPLEASLSDFSCWDGGSLALATWESGVPWRWRPGGWGSGVPWHWRPGCLLVVPHCLVAPTRRQHHRLDHHACDPSDGTLCIGCCSDMQRRDDLSPSTWITLPAVGRPSAVPCDTGDGLSPSTWSTLSAVGQPSAVPWDTGDGLSPSTWSTLSAVGQPSAVPCDTGDGLSPSTWSTLSAVGQPSAVPCDTGDGLSPSTWSTLSAVGRPSAVPCDTGDGLSPSTWSTLSAVGRPSAVPCDTGDGLSPSTWSTLPAVGRPSAVPCDTGDGLSPSTWSTLPAVGRPSAVPCDTGDGLSPSTWSTLPAVGRPSAVPCDTGDGLSPSTWSTLPAVGRPSAVPCDTGDGLSPSTWSTLPAVGRPSAVPCDRGARWIPRSLLSFPKAFQGCWRTQTAGQSGILSISRPYFWPFRLSERISTHTPVWLMLSLCPFRQLKSECPRSILLWPAPPLRYHLSRWKGCCHTPALFAGWEWGSLSATCFWRFWWEDTHATVLVFPGPQVSFPSRSLFPLLGRSVECHISNCDWQAGLAEVKTNKQTNKKEKKKAQLPSRWDHDEQ